MIKASRRSFLQSLVALAACDTGDASTPAPSTVCGGQGARIPFLDEPEQVKDTLVGEGLDGRLYTNLAMMTCPSVVPNDRFYVRTRVPDRIDYASPWRIRGDVDIGIDDLRGRARSMGVTLLECSGNARGGSFGLMSVATWSGVPLLEVIDVPNEQRVLVAGFDDHSKPSERSVPGASWIFTRSDLEQTGAFLATRMNDAELPKDHGFPVRLVVPGWYGCTCIKWVDTIRLLPNDEPSTPHMREFASRTHQEGEPLLARDFRAAEIDLAAMPLDLLRLANDELLFRGIYWGGANVTDVRLELLLLQGGRDVVRAPVTICCQRTSTRTWGFWSATARADRSALPYDVALRSLVANVRTRRLDSRFYARSFNLG